MSLPLAIREELKNQDLRPAIYKIVCEELDALFTLKFATASFEEEALIRAAYRGLSGYEMSPGAATDGAPLRTQVRLIVREYMQTWLASQSNNSNNLPW